MSRVIFRNEYGTREEWLRTNTDGSLSHHLESGGRDIASGRYASEAIYSAEEAKARWPEYAVDIDAAVAEAALVLTASRPPRAPSS